MWRFIRGFFAIVGGLFLILLLIGLGGVYLAYQRWETPEALPPSMVLQLDLRQQLSETPPSGLRTLIGAGPTVADIVLTLDRAAADPRVRGVVALMDETEQGLAVTQELRDAIARLRKAGKFTVAWTESFGELSPANQAYYLASAFEEVDMMPSGTLGLTSLAVQTLNAKDLLDRLGVVLSVTQRESFKSAFETFSRQEPSEANLHQLMALLVDSVSQFSTGIGDGRHMSPEAAQAAMAAGPYTAEEAKAAGLIDNLLYRDQLLPAVLARADNAKLVDLLSYAETLKPPAAGTPKVALVRAAGLIVRGDEEAMGRIAAGDLARTLEAATDDPGVKAIVLRIDSPGGSPVASDVIARQIHLAIEAGKPVIVSMGNVAASGGYWVSMGATRIVAQPGTLTGSIGVIAAKPIIGGLMDKAGITATTLSSGDNGGMWSMMTPYSPTVQARIDAIMDATYAAFLNGVAEGRKLDPAAVRNVAQGRVWSGQSAIHQGLVDRLGGLHEALDDTRRALGLAPDAPLDLVSLPLPRSVFEQLRDMAKENLGLFGTIETMAGYVMRASALTALPMTEVH